MLYQTVVDLYCDLASDARILGKADIEKMMLQQARQEAYELADQNSELARAQMQLIEIYKRYKQFSKLEKIQRSILDIYTRVFGADDPRLIPSLDELADTCNTQGKYKEAEYYLRRALLLHEAMYMPNRQELASRLRRLAKFYVAWGRTRYAKMLANRAKKLEPEQSQSNHQASCKES